ncbi:MAG: hypothetical protein KFF73_07695 [Cyclobacteriaceae bacterium]|nr:hypothetical protein [Cyclobacteriaceae bacterium]
MHSFPVFFPLLVLMVLISCGQPARRESKPADSAEDQETGTPQTKPETSEQIQRQKNPKTLPEIQTIHMDTILGAWIRPDGNYILEFTGLNEDNTLEAYYYNPKPIKISQSQVKREDRIKIYVEFDDTNYRGSYYDLQYDLANDALTGNYYQATYGQTYPIAFIRHVEPD